MKRTTTLVIAGAALVGAFFYFRSRNAQASAAPYPAAPAGPTGPAAQAAGSGVGDYTRAEPKRAASTTATLPTRTAKPPAAVTRPTTALASIGRTAVNGVGIIGTLGLAAGQRAVNALGGAGGDTGRDLAVGKPY